MTCRLEKNAAESKVVGGRSRRGFRVLVWRKSHFRDRRLASDRVILFECFQMWSKTHLPAVLHLPHSSFSTSSHIFAFPYTSHDGVVDRSSRRKVRQAAWYVSHAPFVLLPFHRHSEVLTFSPARLLPPRFDPHRHVSALHPGQPAEPRRVRAIQDRTLPLRRVGRPAAQRDQEPLRRPGHRVRQVSRALHQQGRRGARKELHAQAP